MRCPLVHAAARLRRRADGTSVPFAAAPLGLLTHCHIIFVKIPFNCSPQLICIPHRDKTPDQRGRGGEAQGQQSRQQALQLHGPIGDGTGMQVS